MGNFFTENIPSWWARFKNAFWDATAYLWDDPSATWDAKGDDAWQTPDPKTWKTDN